MTKEEYLRLRPIIYKGVEALKKNDFDAFFSAIRKESSDTIADIYEFFVTELGMDPLNYMTTIPKKFFSKMPIETL